MLKTLYDDVIIPQELEGYHVKRAITMRNRWMVDQSQYMIAYVCRNYGGAFTSMRYAKKKGLSVYNLAIE